MTLSDYLKTVGSIHPSDQKLGSDLEFTPVPLPPNFTSVPSPLGPVSPPLSLPPPPGSRTAGPLSLAISRRRVQALIRRTAYGNISTLGRTLPDADSLGLGDGRQLQSAILYADLRGFTSLVASSAKRETLVVLDTFVSEMTRIALAFHGEVVDCAGDRILAAFWRPAHDLSPEPIRDAVACGFWMQTVMSKVVIPQLAAKGYSEISCGIGIDYGAVVVARVGIRNRNKLVFLGAPAVYAAKLEDIAAPGSVVISKRVHDLRPSYLNSTNRWSFIGGPSGSTNPEWYSCSQIFSGESPPSQGRER